MKNIHIAGFFLLMTGCMGGVSSSNIDSAKVIHIEFPDSETSDKKIIGKLSDGTNLVGKYSPVKEGITPLSKEFAEAQGASGYTWAATQGFTLESTPADRESGLEGREKLVFECIYAVVRLPTYGNGVCQDHKGRVYKFLF